MCLLPHTVSMAMFIYAYVLAYTHSVYGHVYIRVCACLYTDSVAMFELNSLVLEFTNSFFPTVSNLKIETSSLSLLFSY